MRRALVTGGAGFIGSHLCERLLEEGWEVVILDDFSTGSYENIKGIMGDTRCRVVEGSVLDGELVKRLVEECEVVYHLAAVVGVKLVVEEPLRAIEVNVEGTENVLRACQDWGGRRILLASSSEVYGKSEKARFCEDDDRILGPTNILRWVYASTKALDELMGLAYFRKYGLPVVIVRLFSIVGPRQTGRYGMVIPRFVEQALRGGPITIYGDGKQIRSFTYVKDAVEAMMELMKRDDAAGEIFNLGSEEGVTIRELADMVMEVVGRRVPVEYIPYEKVYGRDFEDMRYRVPDVSKLREAIGFNPKTSLRKIVEEVVEDMRRRIL